MRGAEAVLDNTELRCPVLKEAVLMRSFMEDEKMLRARDSQYRLSYGAVALPSSE